MAAKRNQEARDGAAMMGVLRLAIESRSAKVFDLVVAKGLSDQEAVFALELCVRAENAELFGKALAVKADWSRVFGAMEPLARAAEKGLVGMSRSMLAANFPTEPENAGSLGALARAALAGQEAVVKMLVSSGARLDARLNHPSSHSDGWTPLHHAARAGKEQSARIVAFLCSKGADVDARAADGDTPLMSLARRERGGALESKALAAAAEALIAAGADVNALDAADESVAVLAARSRNSLILGALLGAGVDKDQRSSSDGKSLLEIALDRDVYGIREDCAKLLLDAGASPPEKIQLTPKGRLQDFVKVVEGFGYKQVLSRLQAIKESRLLGRAASGDIGKASRGSGSKSL